MWEIAPNGRMSQLSVVVFQTIRKDPNILACTCAVEFTRDIKTCSNIHRRIPCTDPTIKAHRTRTL